MEGFLIKQLGILLVSAVKFIVAAPASSLLGFSYLHTIINTSIGGWLGVIVFYYLGRYIFSHFAFWRRGVKTFYRKIIGLPVNSIGSLQPDMSGKKVFTRRNRIIVKIIVRFGFPGLIILTPVLLSIPLGTFLVVRYYSYRRWKVAWLTLSVLGWSVVLSTFSKLF